jgi:ribonuclease HII
MKPEFIISDGNRFKAFQDIPHQTIVKGDSKFLSIAAASVLAKTHRDEMMEELHKLYPMYEWKKNKAYPTPLHRKAIAEFGPSELHRMSFNLSGDKEFYELKKAAKKTTKKAAKKAGLALF